MSRIGKQPIEVPAGVDVVLQESGISVKGPKGEMKLNINPGIRVGVDEGVVNVSRSSDEAKDRALHGLVRALIANMIEGVDKGFQKTLEIQGVGYRAEKKGSGLLLNLGFSHTIDYPAPEGINIDLPDQTTIVIDGVDKQAVGQTAAEIRAFRPPEPYKGKGIRYQGEHVRRKAGKTAGS
ncbi:MAG: 50S ribosomal protein L6 [Longimicrobiales bacterium]|nr:50S ribosomal protein L6 [Longimicrobiales bacterium]